MAAINYLLTYTIRSAPGNLQNGFWLDARAGCFFLFFLTPGSHRLYSETGASSFMWRLLTRASGELPRQTGLRLRAAPPHNFSLISIGEKKTGLMQV